MDKVIQQAQKKIEYISYNKEDYRQIILREQALLDYTSDMNAYKREGEKTAKIEIAKKMLLKNKFVNEIIEFTGLTKKEIEKLKAGK